MSTTVGFAGFVIFMLGAIAAVIFLIWDTRLQRRQDPGSHEAGLDIFTTERSDAWDATDADLGTWGAALRAQRPRPLADPPPAPPTRWEQPMILPTPKRFEWATPPKPPLRPRGHGPTTLQFTAIAKAESNGVEPELGPDEPTWVSWTAMELPLLKEIP